MLISYIITKLSVQFTRNVKQFTRNVKTSDLKMNFELFVRLVQGWCTAANRTISWEEVMSCPLELAPARGTEWRLIYSEWRPNETWHTGHVPWCRVLTEQWCLSKKLHVVSGFFFWKVFWNVSQAKKWMGILLITLQPVCS